MTAKYLVFGLLPVLAITAAGCGEVAREGRSPVIAVVRSLQAASGAEPDDLGGTLLSDVQTMVTSPAPCTAASPCPVIFNDLGEVEMTLISKNPSVSGPSELNSVTFTRYRVEYRRTDGQKQPGVDVPWSFDSGITFTVPNDGVVTAGFQIVRSSAKLEAPLRALAFSGNQIATIADVTFYGRDQAGNDVIVTASIGIDFGNFADPA